jgi:hypothetical protein
MCGFLYVVLPQGADDEAVDKLTCEFDLGRGIDYDHKLQRTLASGGFLRDSERIYRVWPTNDFGCDCGRRPAEYAPLLTAALERTLAPFIGVLKGEADWQPLSGNRNWWPPTRRESVSSGAFAGGQHDDDFVVYIVEPDREGEG